MKAKFYGKQDYSVEGQKRKLKDIENSLDRRVNKQINNKELFNFKLICEEPSFFNKIKMIFKRNS